MSASDSEVSRLASEFIKANTELMVNRDIKSLVNIVPYVMEFVEKLGGKRTGPEKKKLVIDVVNKVFENTTIGGPLDPIIDSVVKLVVPELIEICISVSKNEFNLQTVKNKVCSCFPCLRN